MAPKRKVKKEASIAPPAASQLPNWPLLKPLTPANELSLVDTFSEQIVTIPNFWPSALCKTYVSFLSTLPMTTTPGKPKKGDAVRVNDRFQVDDPAFAQRLWNDTALHKLVTGQINPDGLLKTPEQLQGLWGGEVVGLNPNIRIYRYSKGQFFDQHYDDSNDVMIPGQPSVPARTTWTLLLYLTSPTTGCLGGETVFYPEPEPKTKRSKAPLEPLMVNLQVGLALLHRHGAHCMLHEGREVLQGEKWVIRSDLCVRK